MMMKTKKINTAFLLLLITLGFMTSCVQDDDYDTPDTSVNQLNVDPADVIPIGALIDQAPSDAAITFTDSIHYIEGYVISSDEAGNFYQELIIQDKPENPTAGLKILLSVNPLFTKYEIGRKVYVKLNGFTFTKSDGIPTMGIPDGQYLGEAPASFEDKIKRTTEVDPIVPLPVSISDAPNHQGVFVKLENVEFTTADMNKSFADEPTDSYDAVRNLESCLDENNYLTFSTSTFADFKALKLPQGSGSINGIILRNFNNSENIISVNDPSDLNFDQDRCDGNGPDPGDPTIVDLPFSENFEGLSDYDPITLEGWTNQNVNGGATVWQSRSFDSNSYAQTSAYNSDENPYEAWLVTPGLDLTNLNSATLSFETNDGYYNGDALSVYASTDFTGDVNQATWTELTGATIASGDTDGYGTFIGSGDLDLSSYAGQVVYIGYKYEGSANGVTSTYQIDNVSVTGN